MGTGQHQKSAASAATIGVSPEVIARIHRLKALTVNIKAGNAVRTCKLVKSSNPDDLVFQSVKEGKPMSDQNILKLHVQPVARRLGLNFVDGHCLRRSYATGLVQSGADPQVGTRSNAALADFYQARHLRADGSSESASSAGKAVRVRENTTCHILVTIVPGLK